MIQEKILIMEYEIASNLPLNKEKMQAVSELKKAFKKIDKNSEIIPNGDLKRLKFFFESILKRDLSSIEQDIINQLLSV